MPAQAGDDWPQNGGDWYYARDRCYSTGHAASTVMRISAEKKSEKFLCKSTSEAMVPANASSPRCQPTTKARRNNPAALGSDTDESDRAETGGWAAEKMREAGWAEGGTGGRSREFGRGK